MHTFEIQCFQEKLKVTEEPENCFSVELPPRKLHLQLKQDNEGANHWFEAGKDKETEEAYAVGLAIERYLNNKK
jgi:hypothetical protein